MHFILPYILYLCSQNAEIAQEPTSRRIYKPWKLSPKHKYREVKQMQCATKDGMKIRNFKKMQAERKLNGKGSMKAPHMRRAHYHRYWVGSGENRHIEIKWVAPTYIHEDMKDLIKPTNAKIKETY